MTNPTDAAFPSDPVCARDARQGLTKREYFAAMAMQGISNCSRHITRFGVDVSEFETKPHSDDWLPGAYTKVALSIADALILELNK